MHQHHVKLFSNALTTSVIIASGLIISSNINDVQAADTESTTITSEIQQSDSDIASSTTTGIKLGATNNQTGSEWNLDSNGTLHIQAGTWGNIDTNPLVQYKSQINAVSFEGLVTAGDKITSLFKGDSHLSSITGLENFDTSQTSDFSNLFSDCWNLQQFDLNDLKLNSAINMASMFENSGIRIASFAGLNGKLKATNYTQMFEKSQIEKVDLSGFSFAKDADLTSMFGYCTELTDVNLENVDWQSVSQLAYLLTNDYNIENLDLSTASNFNDLNGTIQQNNIELTHMLEMGNNANLIKLKSITLNENNDLTDTILNFNTQKYAGWTSSIQDTPITSAELVNKYTHYKYAEGSLETTKQEVPTGTITWTLTPIPTTYFNPQISVSYSGNPSKNKIYDVNVPTEFDDINDFESTQADLDKLPTDTKNLNLKESKLDFTQISGEGEWSCEDFFSILNEQASGTINEKGTLKELYNELFNYINSRRLINLTMVGQKYVFMKVVYDGDGNTNNNHSGSGSSANNSNKKITDLQQTISTFKNPNWTSLYDDNGKKVTDLGLHADSGWYSDKKMVLDNVTYYRVATNKWVKATEVYPYTDHPSLVTVYKDNYGHLINATGKQSDRALSPATDWQADRIATINGEQYYRVATDEFVKLNQVYEYINKSSVINIPTTTVTYTEKGMPRDEKLTAGTSYLTDRYTMINNEIYHRIGFNQFIKPSN